MTNPQKVVIPAQAGIHAARNPLKVLVSRFHGNDEIGLTATLIETIKDSLTKMVIASRSPTAGE
jgi:hypothetical protein